MNQERKFDFLQPENIKWFRQFLAVSQEEFARLLEVSFVTVNRWEQGKAKPSRLAQVQLEKLARKEGTPRLYRYYSRGQYKRRPDIKRKMEEG